MQLKVVNISEKLQEFKRLKVALLVQVVLVVHTQKVLQNMEGAETEAFLMFVLLKS